MAAPTSATCETPATRDAKRWHHGRQLPEAVPISALDSSRRATSPSRRLPVASLTQRAPRVGLCSHFRRGHLVPIPNIRKLQDRGVNLVNFYCNVPICAPSRASVWSGRQPHNGRHKHNNITVRGYWNNYEGVGACSDPESGGAGPRAPVRSTFRDRLQAARRRVRGRALAGHRAPLVRAETRGGP